MRDALECAHLYPDGGAYYLAEALSKKLEVPRDHLILGNGSNEVIEFLGHAFLREDDEIITSEHAFIVYKLVAAVFGARTIETPTPDYQHHLDEMSERDHAAHASYLHREPKQSHRNIALAGADRQFHVARCRKTSSLFSTRPISNIVDNPPDTLQFRSRRPKRRRLADIFQDSRAWPVCASAMASRVRH